MDGFLRIGRLSFCARTGTGEGPLACLTQDLTAGGCEPSVIQQTVGSHYLNAQNSKGNQALVPTTSLYTIEDDIIQPEVGPSPTSNLPGASVITVQRALAWLSMLRQCDS